MLLRKSLEKHAGAHPKSGVTFPFRGVRDSSTHIPSPSLRYTTNIGILAVVESIQHGEFELLALRRSFEGGVSVRMFEMYGIKVPQMEDLRGETLLRLTGKPRGVN
jgi:hypothetical protein